MSGGRADIRCRADLEVLVAAGFNKSAVAGLAAATGLDTGAGGNNSGVLSDNENLATVAIEPGVGCGDAIGTHNNDIGGQQLNRAAIPHQPIRIDGSELAHLGTLREDRPAHIAGHIDRAFIDYCSHQRTYGCALHRLIQCIRHFCADCRTRGSIGCAGYHNTIQGFGSNGFIVGQFFGCDDFPGFARFTAGRFIG